MAKNDVQHRFVFQIAVDDPDQVGHVQIKLHELGLKIVGCDLITDVLAFKRNTTKDPDAIDASARVRQLVEESEAAVITAKGLKTIFRAEGLNIGGIHYTLDTLVKQGKLQKIGPGAYQKLSGLLTHSPPPPDDPPPPRRLNGHKPGPGQKHYDVPNFQLILDYMKGKRRIVPREIVDLFEANGRPTKSFSSIISKFTKRDPPLLRRVGVGEYEVLGNNVKAYEKKQAEQSGAATNG